VGNLPAQGWPMVHTDVWVQRDITSSEEIGKSSFVQKFPFMSGILTKQNRESLVVNVTQVSGLSKLAKIWLLLPPGTSRHLDDFVERFALHINPWAH
jgi:hypothetical protein